ncbi:MAG: phosphoenolpyruvate carboxylase, partial [Gemmatimonadota bacterium]
MNTHRATTDLRTVSFPEKDEPLRRDVHLLGSIVGEVVEEQAGRARFEQVEAARVSAIARREGDARAGADLDQRLSGLVPSEASELARAFSTYFQAVNLAEQVHRVRRGRAYLRAGEAQDGSTLATLHILAERGLDRSAATELIGRILVEPVFTAHPTEATRRIILEKQRRVAERLIERLDPSRTPRDERSLLGRIRTELTTAWQTEEHPGLRPRVRDESEHVHFYLSEVLYDVVPVLTEVIEEALEDGFEDGFGTTDAESNGGTVLPVRFASWVGGDMDGNPNVGADTLLETLDRHREVVLARYERDLRSLARRLSQSRPEVE